MGHPHLSFARGNTSHRTQLDANDEIAALERIQYALSEVGDGATYVWRRWHGQLSGIVQPTSSFRDTDGRVCRHMVVMLTTGTRTKKQEGIACRLPSGRWQLDG
jgi:surface antigen